MALLDLIKQFGQANYNYGLFNGNDNLQKQFDAERMDLFKQITKQVKVEPEVKVNFADVYKTIDKLIEKNKYMVAGEDYNVKVKFFETKNKALMELKEELSKISA